jgi:sugar-specific transcriptional regulator TrmB
MFDEIKKDKILSDLKSLGLDEKEAVVYISLLRIGETGSSKIIQDTGLHGQFVYNSLKNLENKDLVEHNLKHGRKKFRAKSPKTFTRLAFQQQKIAHNVVEELNKIMVLPPEQEYEVVQGQEAFRDLQLELMDEAPENSELLVISGSGDKYMEMMGSDIRRNDRLRAKKNVLIRYVGCIEQKEFLSISRDIQGLFEFRLLSGLFTGDVNTNIWDNAITFNIFSSPVTCFLIRNPIIAGSYKQFFETLWNMAK